MSWCNDILAFLGVEAAQDEYSLAIGFYFGLGIVTTTLLLLLVFRVVRKILGLKASKELLVKTSHGEMSLTATALKEFISHELESISDIRLLKINLFPKGSLFNLLVEISAPQMTNIPQLTEQIKNCVDNGLKDILGISTAKKIDIRLKKFHEVKGRSTHASFTSDQTFAEKEVVIDEATK
jgi:uncharacterized alkaline shock family protein YloU